MLENNQITKWIKESEKETIQYEQKEADLDLSNSILKNNGKKEIDLE